MRGKAGLSSPSLFYLRTCSLVYIVLAVIFPPVWAEFDKHIGVKVSHTKEAFDSIENSKHSAASSRQRAHNKIDGGRNYTADASPTVSGERNSAALEKFLEDVRRAKSDLKWTDHAGRRVDYGPRTSLNDQPVYTSRYSAVSVNTGNVPGRADIGYGSGLRGKRSFDRNYETMWTPRGAPRRAYPDNDVTFERDADFNALYQFPGMSDRAVYEGEAMADQPLKDWTGKKDPRSSGDWPNSNENPEVTNGESARLREPAREFPDSSRDTSKLRVGADTQPAAPIRAGFSAGESSPGNEKSQNIPMYLESLKKTVLELKHSLTPGNEKKATISKGEKSNWRDGPRSAVGILDFENVPDDRPVGEATWGTKRAENIGSRDESDARISRGLYFAERNPGEPRGKRTRRSFVANMNYTNDRTDTSGRTRYRGARVEDAPGNVTALANSEGIGVKSRTDCPNGSLRTSGETNTPRAPEPSLSDNSINSTAVPKTDYDGRTVPDPKCPARLESCLSNRSVADGSLVEINPRASSRERVVTSEVPELTKTSGQFFTDEESRVDGRSSGVGRNIPVLSATAISTRLPKSDGDADDEAREKSARNRGGEAGDVAARKISRLGAGQSKGAGAEAPRGNTSRGSVANESRCRVVETAAAATEREDGARGARREEAREPIPGVITASEPRGRPHQKRETETAPRLSRRTEGGGTSAAEITASAGDASAGRRGTPIDPVARPGAGDAGATGEPITPRNRRAIIADGDSRAQQQMVPRAGAGRRSASKSDGNSDTGGIDIRPLGPRGNETMNVKEDARAAAEAAEAGGDLRRKLLWIAATSVGAAVPPTDSAKPIPDSSIGPRVDPVPGENRREEPTTNSSDFKALSRVKREDNAEDTLALPSALGPRTSDANRARCTRSPYSDENSEVSNEAGPRDAAVEREAAENTDDKQEDDDEEYSNLNVETSDGLRGDYNNREEDAVEDDKSIENGRAERSSHKRKIDPIKAKVDLLIKKKLGRKKEEEYRRRRRSTLDMIEYYDYDDDEEQRRDAPVNERQEDEKLSLKDEAKTKREGRTTANLGKKKNEHAEEMMKQEILKKQRKHKEPKEEIIVDVGERKNKTGSGKDDRKPASSSGSSLEDRASEDERSTKDNSAKIRQSEGFANAYYEGDLKLKWLGRSSEIVSPGSSESAVKGEKELGSTGNVSKANVNTDVIENILLNFQPFELEQKREMEVSDDFDNKRSDGRYDYQENDRGSSNNVEPLYEALKNVYDWSDELKSGPRLRGDQRLRYESDDKPGTNPSQLQPLNDRFHGSDQNARIRPSDASRATGLNSTPVSNYPALKVADDMFRGDPERAGSVGENSPRKFCTGASVEPKVAGNKTSSFPELSAIERAIDANSGSPRETRRKRNSSPEKPAAISSQDLRESFVESPDWDGDFDGSARLRLGRGLKAADEAWTPDSDEVDGSAIGNAADINSGFNFGRSSRGNLSISRDRCNNTPAGLINIYSRNRYNRSAKQIHRPNSMSVLNGDEDLEVAEQRYTVRRASRNRRAAAYDDSNPGNSDEESNPDSRFSLPNAREYARNWDDSRDLDRYLKTPRVARSGKREKLKGDKRKKHFSGKHARKKNSSRSSSSRGRRQHAHRSDASRNNLKPRTTKKKDKAGSASVTGRAGARKGKPAERGLLRAAVNEDAPLDRVLYENAGDQSTVKPEKDDARRKEIALLLAADNVDDESQMDMAVHGELAGKIVEHIFEQVRKHDQLKKVLGPGLQRTYKENVIAPGNIYRQGLDEDGTNRTETMMKRVMELLDRLILNEVQKRSCVSLSPDMREFLGWMLEADREEEPSEEALPLPLVREEIIPERSTERQFLFDTTGQGGEESVSDLQTKVRVLETLVKEYNALTAKEKTRVQPVHDYLVRQLNLLLQHIEARQSEEKPVPTGAARAKTGSFLQYQSAAPNTTNAGYSIGKDALLLPIDTRNFFQFNNASLNMADGQFRDNHVAPHYREARSLDKASSKRRETKHHPKRDREKIGSRKSPKRKRGKRRRARDRAGGSPSLTRRKSRRRGKRRANRKENDSPRLGYEEPAIYDSLELLDSELTGPRGGKRKRESAGKGGAASERTPGLLPTEGKNRLEDEVMLLNKREAWKRENEKQLEEVAFGRDMRNSTKRERRLEELTAGDKRGPVDGSTGPRTKREGTVGGSSAVGSADRPDDSRAASEIGGRHAEKPPKQDNGDDGDNGARNEDRLESLERTINVFGGNGSDAAAADTAAARAGAGEKSAGADNEVNGELRAANRGTKIDGRASLTSDTKPRVSRERRKLSGADRGAVKLNRAMNNRHEEADPEAELKSLRSEAGAMYGAAGRRNATFRGDRNLTRDKLGEKYPTELDEPDDPDPENNSELPRLGSNERPGSVVEWKLLPVMRTRPYRGPLSAARLIRREISPLSVVRDVEVQPAYFGVPRLRRARRRGRRNGVLDILPSVLRVVDDGDARRRGLRPKVKRVAEVGADFEGSRADSKIPPTARKLSRPRGDRRSDGDAELAASFALRGRELREAPRSLRYSEADDRAMYGFRLPVWRYYDRLADPPTLHLAPDLERDVYRYSAYSSEYGPFEETRARGSKRRLAEREFPLGNFARGSRRFSGR